MIDLFTALEEKYGEGSEEETMMLPKGKRPPITFGSVSGREIGRTKGKEDELRRKYSSLTHLDLSKNKITSWEEALEPLKVLPMLASLDLSENPLDLSQINAIPKINALQSLTVNNLGLTWDHVLILLNAFPRLNSLSLVGNSMKSISSSTINIKMNELQTINIDSNQITSWTDIQNLVFHFCPSLTRLFISGNVLGDDFSFLSQQQSNIFSKSIIELSIADNKITSWETISTINKLFPNLTSFRLAGNPLLSSIPPLTSRIKVLSYLPTLTSLNGSTVRSAELDEAARLNSKQQQIESQSFSTATSVPSGFLQITIQCNAASGSKQGTVQQKLPGSMKIRDLHLLCQRLFGVNASDQALFFRENLTHDKIGAFPQPMDNDSYELQMFCNNSINSGLIVVEDKQKS